MSLLILNLPGLAPRGLLLAGRVVIGRRPFDTILIPDPSVSRIHAWIGAKNGHWLIYDAGSRSGTFVNGQIIDQPAALADGDEIRIGAGTLTFLDGDQLPADVEPLAPSPPPPASDPYDGGIYFDCACGGPMWVAAELAGAAGRCRYCGQRLIVPHKSGQTARRLQPAGTVSALPRRLPPTPPINPPPAPAAEQSPEQAQRLCSICQTEIRPDEEQTRCPSCHLTFHHACWLENYGCSAYGCDQVNILAPRGEEQAPAPPVIIDATDLLPHPARHWDLVLLALSFVAMGLGPLAYGVTSAIMLVWTALFLATRKAQRPVLVVLGLAVSIIGTLAGLATSLFLFNGVRLWEKVLK